MSLRRELRVLFFFFSYRGEGFVSLGFIEVFVNRIGGVDFICMGRRVRLDSCLVVLSVLF